MDGRFATTKVGYMSLVPMATEPSDRTAIVLRGKASSSCVWAERDFLFLLDCYIHRIMNVKAMDIGLDEKGHCFAVITIETGLVSFHVCSLSHSYERTKKSLQVPAS